MPALDFPPILAYAFDGKGAAREIGTDAAGASATEDAGFVWAHVGYETETGGRWLADASGLDASLVEALTAPETRPRCAVHTSAEGAGVFINLRGVNLHEGAEPEDMISIRMWVCERRIVSAWRRPLHALRDVLDSIEREQAPASPGDFVARVALRLADRAEPVVAALNETVDDMEEEVLASDTPTGLRARLADVRRTAILLRRYMFPQRDALSTLAIEDLPWLSSRERSRLREATDRITRLAEELDAIRDRAAVVHDQIVEQRGEAMNRSMLILAVVAAIFLPLGLLTGLLGINVGGVPGADTSWAFWAVCGLLGVATVFQIWLFRRLRLM